MNAVVGEGSSSVEKVCNAVLWSAHKNTVPQIEDMAPISCFVHNTVQLQNVNQEYGSTQTFRNRDFTPHTLVEIKGPTLHNSCCSINRAKVQMKFHKNADSAIHIANQ